MKTNPIQTLADSRSCKFFVVYDDLESGKRAKETCDFIVGQFGFRGEIHDDFWRLDLLQEPALKKTATRNAAGADIIIFSTKADVHLSDEIKTWLEECLHRKTDRPRMLVAVSCRSRRASGSLFPIETHLQEIATRNGVDYLPRIVETEDGANVSVKEERVYSRPRRADLSGYMLLPSWLGIEVA